MADDEKLVVRLQTKVFCSEKTETTGWIGYSDGGDLIPNGKSCKYTFYTPVRRQDDPTLSTELTIASIDTNLFEVGKEYYLDLTPV